MEMRGNAERVNIHTAHEWNRKIEDQIERNVTYYAAHPDEIDARLKELNREWDIERTLEANAAAVSIAGVVLGILGAGRRWFFLPAVVGGFLLNHAVKGWCPPLPMLRRMGVRTQAEIERERYALKALRGDFNNIDGGDVVTESDLARVSQRVLKAVK